MNSHPGELLVPAPATDDPRAVEMLRVWAAGGKQHVTIAVSLWPDPANWGIMLVDLAKHIANAYVQSGGKSRDDMLRRLRQGFDAEWDSPTDSPSGNIKRD